MRVDEIFSRSSQMDDLRLGVLCRVGDLQHETRCLRFDVGILPHPSFRESRTSIYFVFKGDSRLEIGSGCNTRRRKPSLRRRVLRRPCCCPTDLPTGPDGRFSRVGQFVNYKRQGVLTTWSREGYIESLKQNLQNIQQVIYRGLITYTDNKSRSRPFTCLVKMTYNQDGSPEIFFYSLFGLFLFRREPLGPYCVEDHIGPLFTLLTISFNTRGSGPEVLGKNYVYDPFHTRHLSSVGVCVCTTRDKTGSGPSSTTRSFFPPTKSFH